LLRVLVCLWLVAACWAEQPGRARQVPAASYRISGKVVDSLSGEPLGQVEVGVSFIENSGTTRNLTAQTLTKDDGQFAFENLRAGKYSLAAQKRGYGLQAFDQHGSFATAIAAGPNLTSDGLVFRLQPQASIVGRILDEEHEAVPNAAISLYATRAQDGVRHQRDIRGATTDDQGSFRMSHLQPGSYYLTVTARPWYADNHPQPGGSGPIEPSLFDVTYPVTYYGDVTDASQATPIAIHPGERSEIIVNLTAVPAGHIRILVPNSNPQSTQITLTKPQIDGSERAVPVEVADAGDGRLDLSGIPPGEVHLKLQAIQGGGQEKHYAAIDVSGNRDVDTSGSSPFASVTGVLRLAGYAQFSSQIAVRLQSRTSELALDAPVSADGDFDFQEQDVPPGRYDVLLTNAPGMVVSGVAATGATAGGQSIEIRGQTQVRLVVLAAREYARVDGIALRGGKPAPGAMILLVPQNMDEEYARVRRDQSDSDGTFSLFLVVPGKYTVLAIDDGWDLEWASPSVLRPYMAEGTPVQVTANSTHRIEAKVQSLTKP